ncbi:hypothetical protein AB595_04755 [Massilia sp. WF1]|uniref:hypothetical protein n=1 Tax=unclassified Massilia TaxID=2609279 RepID=UPI000649A21B|nr:MULTISPECIES: hypothetical protein [unclassified Massilia]ALK96985.1 hypothetical protein AM586_12665 [Massilia sp. WG5]KLU37935.1 hypothetical protein AB595_04755 [Massilia sp. WF1]
MAITKTPVVILASALSPAGTSKTAPGLTGGAIDCRSYYGGELTWKITNGASAPGVALSLTFQVSHDGANWYDYFTVAGDTTASSVNSGSVQLDRGVMYARAIAYGNTTNGVTAETNLQAVTAL